MANPASFKILTTGAAGMLVAAFVLAWIATSAKLIPIQAIGRIVKDYGAVIRAHIDFMLMALFCLAFAELPVALPTAACVLVVMGGFMNPSLFVIRGLRPDLGPSRAMRVYRLASFSISTCGFMWLVAIIARYAMA